ncbi:MAG: helix-turn-helix domain-containing protein [Blastocatellia bacterium]
MSDERLTTKDAAERLGVTVGRIRQLVLAGTLPAEKFGRDLVIKAVDLASVTIYGKPGRPKKLTDAEGQTDTGMTAEVAPAVTEPAAPAPIRARANGSRAAKGKATKKVRQPRKAVK